MIGNQTSPQAAREVFLAELTAVALEVARRSGVQGPSVDLELDIWNELGVVLCDWRSRPARASFTWEERLAALTDAAYRVMLDYHFTGTFVDLEMGLWRELRQVIRRNRFLPAAGADHGTERSANAPVHLSRVLLIA